MAIKSLEVSLIMHGYPLSTLNFKYPAIWLQHYFKRIR